MELDSGVEVRVLAVLPWPTLDALRLYEKAMKDLAHAMPGACFLSPIIQGMRTVRTCK